MEKVLIFTNHFYPEVFRVNDLAFDLRERGFEVTVLTAIPDYPRGKFFEGYGFFKRRVEWIHGVKVIRVAIIPRGRGSSVRLLLNYGSSFLSFMMHALYQSVFHKYDVLFIHNTSPATICMPAILVKGLRKTPIIHWLLDMWPENLVAGGIRSPKIFKLVNRMMMFIYRHCDRIQITSLGFRKLLTEKGVGNSKIEYLPNWSDEGVTQPQDIPVQSLPKGFVILFAGNMGYAQNLENVMYAAQRTTARKDIHWVFLGDGRKKEWVERFVSDNNLADTVHLLGRQPVESMSSYFAKADVMLVSLCDEISFNLTLPAKVQAYMSCAKPIVGLINGETQEIIRDSGCGWTVPADDFVALADLVEKLASLSKDILKEYGDKGKTYYKNNFQKSICMNRLEKAIHEITSKQSSPNSSVSH